MWKANGSSGLAAKIDHVMSLAGDFAELIRQRQGFYLVSRPSCTNVCFWFIPDNLRASLVDQLEAIKAKNGGLLHPMQLQFENQDAWWSKLDKVAPKIKERMVKAGSMMMTYTKDGGPANFFRFALVNSKLSSDDLTFFVNEIERLGKDI